MKGKENLKNSSNKADDNGKSKWTNEGKKNLEISVSVIPFVWSAPNCDKSFWEISFCLSLDSHNFIFFWHSNTTCVQKWYRRKVLQYQRGKKIEWTDERTLCIVCAKSFVLRAKKKRFSKLDNLQMYRRMQSHSSLWNWFKGTFPFLFLTFCGWLDCWVMHWKPNSTIRVMQRTSMTMSRYISKSKVQFNSIDKCWNLIVWDRIIRQKCLTTIFQHATTISIVRRSIQMVIDDEYLVNWLDINLKFVACSSSLNGSIKMLHNWTA